MHLTTELLKTSSIVRSTCGDSFGFFLCAMLPLLPIFLAHEIFLPSSNLGLVLVLKFLSLYGWAYLIISWTQGYQNNLSKDQIFKNLFPDKKILNTALILFASVCLLNYLGGVAGSVIQSSYFTNHYIWFYSKVGISVLTNMLLIYLIARSIFVFIAKLEDKKLSVESSFHLTKNKTAEILGSGILAAFPYIAFLLIYKTAIKAYINWQYPSGSSEIGNIMLKILVIPIEVIFTPWIVIMIFTSALYYYKRHDNSALEQTEQQENPTPSRVVKNTPIPPIETNATKSNIGDETLDILAQINGQKKD